MVLTVVLVQPDLQVCLEEMAERELLVILAAEVQTVSMVAMVTQVSLDVQVLLVFPV